VDQVLQILKNKKLYVKISKYYFGKQEVEYLGHIFSRERVKVDPQKIQDITKWPTPKSINILRGFLGLTRYYWKFVKNFACIAGPLTSILNKHSFLWNEEATMAFSLLTYAMTSTLVLTTRNFGKIFIVECDASGQGIGVVLTQEGRPLDFESKQLKGKELVKSTYEKEMESILHVIKNERQYLIGMHFKVKTDHDILKYFLEKTFSSEEQQKWV